MPSILNRCLPAFLAFGILLTTALPVPAQDNLDPDAPDIKPNVPQVEGGGLFNDGGPMTVQNSTISGNQAQAGGGGLFNGGGTMTVQNSTISGNQAQAGGGGLFNGGGTMTVQNSTISGNQAQSNLDSWRQAGKDLTDVPTCQITGIPGEGPFLIPGDPVVPPIEEVGVPPQDGGCDGPQCGIPPVVSEGPGDGPIPFIPGTPIGPNDAITIFDPCGNVTTFYPGSQPFPGTAGGPGGLPFTPSPLSVVVKEECPQCDTVCDEFLNDLGNRNILANPTSLVVQPIPGSGFAEILVTDYTLIGDHYPCPPDGGCIPNDPTTWYEYPCPGHGLTQVLPPGTHKPGTNNDW